MMTTPTLMTTDDCDDDVGNNVDKHGDEDGDVLVAVAVEDDAVVDDVLCYCC